MVRWTLGVLLGTFVAACGGNENEPGGSGGSAGGGGASSGSGGAAGGIALGGSLSGGSGGSAGSGGAAGAANKTRGGFSMHIVPGDGCSLPEQWVDFPVVEGGHPVTATETVQLIEHGATGKVINAAGDLIDTTVSQLVCRWVPDPQFDLSVGFEFGPAGQQGTLSMSASIRLGEPEAHGILLLGQDWDEMSYGGQCTYTALEVDEATRSVRGEVTCAALDRVTDPPDTVPPEACALTAGYYAFENCQLPE